MHIRSLVSVINDDESVRESLPDLLRQFGYAVEAFSSAEEFLTSDSVGQTRYPCPVCPDPLFKGS
jgi:FixJ family two-component response regulator